MILTEKSTVSQVAACVADALSKAGVQAVLSGGACASIHSGGTYQSVDLDFILRRYESPRQVDEAMAGAGFSRRGNQYFHSRARFYVEFPAGPLSIGNDYGITPVEIRLGRKVVLGLSATDSCRDRLAGYFHWNDREGLRAAIAIVQRGKVDLEKIARWAHQEGALAAARHEAFLAELELARRHKPRRTAPTKRSRSGKS